MSKIDKLIEEVKELRNDYNSHNLFGSKLAEIKNYCKKLEQYRTLNLKLEKLMKVNRRIDSIFYSTHSDRTRMCCRRAFIRTSKLERLYNRELKELGL